MAKIIDDETMENVCILAKLSLSEEEKEKLEKIKERLTKEKEYTVDEKIPEIEERIASDDFVRCHTSFLVNFSCVKECTRKKLLLENGKTVDVSRSYWKKTEDAYVEWMKRWAR
jgi:two-component system LytT family response regulator